MSEFKGTKGIWIKTTDGEANFYGICTEKNWLMRIQQNGEKSIQEQEANAKLIATAPELLEKLLKAKSTISRLKNSMRSHPDCEANSEFQDYVELAEQQEFEIELAIKKATE